MARYFEVHPANPQPRAVTQIAEIVRTGGVIAYPTDSQPEPEIVRRGAGDTSGFE